MFKKAQGLSINTIIIAIIVLVVLVVLIMVFTGYFSGWTSTIAEQEIKTCTTEKGTLVAPNKLVDASGTAGAGTFCPSDTPREILASDATGGYKCCIAVP